MATDPARPVLWYAACGVPSSAYLCIVSCEAPDKVVYNSPIWRAFNLANRCGSVRGDPLMAEKLSKHELDALRKITSPTIANAIELFNIRPRNAGFMTPDI